MKASLKVSRGLQLVGALMLIAAVVSCSTGGIDGSGAVGGLTAAGFLIIVCARAYEWMTKE